MKTYAKIVEALRKDLVRMIADHTHKNGVRATAKKSGVGIRALHRVCHEKGAGITADKLAEYADKIGK